jgi:hypothetical protein
LLGLVKGLPQDFTTNGAVVDADGKILVSSAVNGNSYFTIDPADWTATAFNAPGGIFRSSDLANSNYLQTKPKNKSPEFTGRGLIENTLNDKIQVYPNPVTANQFTLQFGKVPAGNYKVELTDVTGRVVMQRTVNVGAEDQVETIGIKPTVARGVFLVTVTEQTSKAVTTQKLVVQ